MSNKDLSRKPHYRKGEHNVWWYEEPEGIEVYMRTEMRIKHCIIPWPVIRSALKRKDK